MVFEKMRVTKWGDGGDLCVMGWVEGIPLHTSFFLFKINDLGTFLPNFPWFMSSSASRCWLPKAPEDV
jgi:hypothetical protein